MLGRLAHSLRNFGQRRLLISPRASDKRYPACPGACVLLCAVELCSLHHQYTHDAEGIVANSLFADGAAACIVRAAEDDETLDMGSCELRGQASHVVDNTADLMSWNIADHGFRMTLSPKVPDTILGQLRPWLEKFLARYKMSVDQVPHWVIHPGGPRIHL
jgi:predicted naringenin-chalcone synthase